MADRLDEWAEQCKSKMLQDFKDRSKRAAEVLVQKTPVRRHARLRKSFRAAINEQPSNTDPGHGNHPVDGSKSLDQIFDTIDQLEIGDTLHVGSDTPGVIELEQGSRRNAPTRMMFAAAKQWGD